jgi:hypothetical protein
MVFGAALFLLSLTVQLAISAHIKGKTISGHDHLTVYSGRKFDVLFLGSSRTADHFIPRVFQEQLGLSSLNMGGIGHADIPNFILKWKYFLLCHPAPRYVVMNLDLATVDGPLEFSENRNYVAKHYFSRYAFISEEHNIMVNDYFGFNITERYMPLYAILRYKMFANCITQKDGKEWMKNGYLAQTGVWKYDPTNTADVMYRQYADTFTMRYHQIKEQLSHLNKLCMTNGAKLICVNTPLYHKAFLNRGFELPGKMCAELNIPFIDMHAHAMTENVQYFSDVQHLNSKGADIFCKQLCADSTFLKWLQP